MKRTILISMATATVLAAQLQHYTVADLGPLGPTGQPLFTAGNEMIAGVDASGSAAQGLEEQGIDDEKGPGEITMKAGPQCQSRCQMNFFRRPT